MEIFKIADKEIDYCYVNGDEIKSANFVDGVAVVPIVVVTQKGEEVPSYSVIKKTESTDSKVENFNLSSIFVSLDINSITRLGNHFIVKRTTWNYDRTKSWTEFLQVDYVRDGEEWCFVERSKIPGIPQFVSEKVLIVTPEGRKSCLFSLEKSDIQSIEYSCIDNIDGETFFVTDTVYLDEDEDIKDRLMFKMNAEGNRITDVYRRSKGEFTDDPLNYPYLLIRERVINDLQEDYLKEKTAEKSLRRG